MTTTTDVRVIDLDEAKQLLADVCAAEPDRTDRTQQYFDQRPDGDNACLCVVGGVLEKLGKGIDDLLWRDPEDVYVGNPDASARDQRNGAIFQSIAVDGLEFTDEATDYLDRARALNDSGIRWGKIPKLLADADTDAEEQAWL
jgi:hypothetical protein